MVAVNKPAGWLVHRAGWIATKSWSCKRCATNRPACFTAHRLDRPTSNGVLVIRAVQRSGRTPSVQQFEQHHIRKRYHAIVLRGWLMDDAVLDYPLVEERDKIADKFAREDESAPAGTL
ncbi:hypothetical protein KCP73_17630 [Salmonella enterica subsp. enterica]|nr:hypothetical protein KCP73_17630 [Salmonella enterica subsp. enterica]